VNRLTDGLAEISVPFSTMESFHPDSLFGRLDIFHQFRDARERLKTGGKPDDAEATGPPPPAAESDSGLLDAVLGETERETPPAGSAIEEDLGAFLRRVVKPHVVGKTPDHSEQLTELDLRTSRLMNALMSAPAFQKLEALWRSVIFLLSRVEVSTNLRVYLIDVSEEELRADILSTDEPTEWGFAHTVLNPISENGEELRWAALLGAFEFGGKPHHIPLLQRIGLLSESGGIPWFAGAHPSLFGSRSVHDQPDQRDWTDPLDPLWVDLRERPEADYLSLSFPGFLLRAPYGSNGGKTKRFDFVQKSSLPEDSLWGNPCILWGVVLARAFARSGWNLRIEGQEAVSQLAMHPTPDGWGTAVKAILSHSAASRVREMGVNPVIAIRGEPQVRLLGFGSVSHSEKGLKSWWNSPV
jgi:type VI secretion system protein ImpC